MKSTLLLAAAAAALSLSACQREPEKAENAVAASDPINAAQDAASVGVGTMSAATTAATNSTEGFVTGLVTSDIYEIAAGKIAQTKGQSAAVKDFGKMMVTEHTAMSNEARPAIVASGEEIPVELDQRRKGLIDNLNAAGPADFDQVYLSQQEAAHQEALTLLQGYADGGDNAALKAVAVKAIPKVQAHLEKVRQLRAAR